MELLHSLYCGKVAPAHDFGENTTPEYETAARQLSEIVSQLRAKGIAEELLLQLEAAESRIVALELERMFRYAISFGAKLQAELSRFSNNPTYSLRG